MDLVGTALNTTIADCHGRGWGLVARCSAGHVASIPLDFPPEALLKDVAARLVCRCGSREGIAYTKQVAPRGLVGSPTTVG
jgi:hypothetical protein